MLRGKTKRGEPLGQPARSCADCAVRQICLPGLLSPAERAEFSGIVKRTGVMHKGDYLYREGQPFTDLYAVFSGFFKARHVDRHGNEEIMSFYFPGEIMGLHALDTRTYQYDVITLNTSVACRIPYEDYKRLATRMPKLDDRLHDIFSRELVRARFSAANLSAVQKVATLLMSFSRRLQERGFSPVEFLLPMTNTDIANRLRLVNETVSRVLGKLAGDGILLLEDRRVKILDLERLAELCPRNLHITDARHLAGRE